MNNNIFFFFYNFAHQSAWLDNCIIFLAVYLPYIVVVLAMIFLLMHHEVFKADNTFQVFLQKKKEIFGAFIVGVITWALAYILKILVHTSRPFDILPQVHSLFPETGHAFPSGHATFFMALAVAIFFYHKKAGYLFMFLALLIGIARIAGGVHFPIDILGGFILGALVAYFMKNV
ncbi:MAG: phosphatase PAP2 family protein [Patescibacteria group bacterium]|nr:phosphatase PAP2 family protein [Patescibacteria group bacterium]